jgi:hypothetical protein
MKVMSVEVLEVGALARLRRDARRERREKRKRAYNMTWGDATGLYLQTLSSFDWGAALPQESTTVESPLPQLAKDQVGRYEEPDAIALLSFARASGGKPVLVGFDCKPSKAYEARLRQAAKVRNLTLHFYRVIDRSAAVEVHPKETPDESDATILGSLGVQW